jgi:23S rRNA (adenine2030-N6)-methyltransferase
LLSYRHSFHAGNFADVLKHIVLIEILQYLCKKPTPFAYIDTHAGAGLYDLQSGHAAKLNEAKAGFEKLRKDDWPELAPYFQVVEHHRASRTDSLYPGSPMIAHHFLRPQDRAFFYELHPRDFSQLDELTRNDPRIQTCQTDGFKGLISQVPPVARRGLILMDPPYEIKTDYETVFNSIRHACKRFSNGIYALWYPVVDRERINHLENRFLNSGLKDIQRFELGMHPDSDEIGMTASGMIVINPPWTLKDTMQLVLPRLSSALGEPGRAFSRCDILVPE